MQDIVCKCTYNYLIRRCYVCAVGGMNRPSKVVTQAKKVAPPAVPDVFRHSGSSFGSAGYASSEDSCFLPGSGPGGTTDDCSYGISSGKSPGPIFTHPGFAFPPVVGKYAHAEDQGMPRNTSQLKHSDFNVTWYV